MDTRRINTIHKNESVGEMKLCKSISDIYFNAEASYKKAQENIEKIGEIVTHPKTGAPIENPYIKIREKSAKQMLDFRKQYRSFNENEY